MTRDSPDTILDSVSVEQPPLRAQHELAVVEFESHVVGGHPGQRDLDQQTIAALVDVYGRFPLRRSGSSGRVEELPLQAFRLLEQLHRVGPHPRAHVST